jgi:hypothetical protein
MRKDRFPMHSDLKFVGKERRNGGGRGGMEWGWERRDGMGARGGMEWGRERRDGMGAGEEGWRGGMEEGRSRRGCDEGRNGR